MVNFIPPPDLRSLLPPLLACLPTAFVSSRPPPALLPLLSPILRQRVQLLSATSASSSDSWLSLLCWDPLAAAELSEIVQSEAFELHPVSGEIEFRDVEDVPYRRLDEETLQARVLLADLGLVVIYLWCEDDLEGGGSGWRVSEVNPAKDTADGPNIWWRTINDADEKAKATLVAEAPKSSAKLGDSVPALAGTEKDEEDDEDDGYWAQYDNTPARTPGKAQSPPLNAAASTILHGRNTSEADYYAQYAKVQPAMDNDDPSENREMIGESSLDGNAVTGIVPMSAITNTSMPSLQNLEQEVNISHPRPSSSSSSSVAVTRLEDSAAVQSFSEIAVRQHISTSLKSLFRLARGSGIDKDEFERLIDTELSALSMMPDDD